ncbi:MAG: NAD-dependent epimerase/dehydratase family protein [Candidatus Delongbacteria bacterium]|nr:NAD-dependent epimerase/dehydratase family protein [Candidatus Delongbacteria bacterium]MBN2834343.1 NAD-dependent epimerase/dehydratase family protein [Candidatus Delongbacteria bacterium]
MNILVIGGTIFLGRYIVESLLSKGHNVTLFNRGKHNPGLYEGKVKIVHGDRENCDDLKKLVKENYDAVIDTCAYFPNSVIKSTSILKDCTKKYVFISTISVYKDEKLVGLDENYDFIDFKEGADRTKLDYSTYGPLKVECEGEVKNAYPFDSLIIRPGYIVGPHDQFDRFNCWIVEGHKERAMICPGDGNDYIQFIDVRDLSDFIVHLIEEDKMGVFNVTGNPIKYAEFIKVCKEIANSDDEIKFLPWKIIEKDNLWSCFPIYTPNIDEYEGNCRVSIEKAVSNGLKLRQIEETFKDVYQFHLSKGKEYKLKEGMTDELYTKIVNENLQD